MKTTYSEKLKDPRWQKKRLEIMERDGFTCLACDATDKQLHVHHCYYVSKREPWEYPDSSLLTFCWDCHEQSGDKETKASQWALAWEREANLANSTFLYVNACCGYESGAPDTGLYGSLLLRGRSSVPIEEAVISIQTASANGLITDKFLISLNHKVRKLMEGKKSE